MNMMELFIVCQVMVLLVIKNLSLSGQTENSLEYTLTYDEDTLRMYPFKFKLTVTYTINFAEVKVSWKVENLDTKEDMYFSIGAHPAFNCPIWR